ncbi:MAG: hypothetical protein ACRDFB_01450 [Rhabdochlamydiaceae bacterium]
MENNKFATSSFSSFGSSYDVKILGPDYWQIVEKIIALLQEANSLNAAEYVSANDLLSILIMLLSKTIAIPKDIEKYLCQT